MYHHIWQNVLSDMHKQPRCIQVGADYNGTHCRHVAVDND